MGVWFDLGIRLSLTTSVAAAANQPMVGGFWGPVTRVVLDFAADSVSFECDSQALLADLEKLAADSVEVKWLRAELAFQSGDYAGAIKTLDKVPDDGGDGLVGQTRKLAMSTSSVTELYSLL